MNCSRARKRPYFKRRRFDLDLGLFTVALLTWKSQSAKQFAAMHALAFLQDRASTTARFVEPAKFAAQPAAPLGQRQTRSESDNGASVFRAVSTLSARLGLGSVTYHVVPDPQPSNTFSGQPLFSTPGIAPNGLGKVEGVYGKMETELQMAETILVWLRAELQSRQGTLNTLLQQNAPGDDTLERKAPEE